MLTRSHATHMHASATEHFFTWLMYAVLAILGLSCILPFIHLAALSLSDSASVSAGAVALWPVHMTLDAYRYAFARGTFLRAFYISVARVVCGVSISLSMLLLTAYPLSKSPEVCPPARVFKVLMIIAMLTGGGLIPLYLVMNWIHLTNTFWALIIPGSLSLWNCFMVMNFFRSIPHELEESAVVDGANSFQTLWKIYLPLSVPVIATMTVFVGVGHWNDWFSAIIYISRSQDYPLQTYLQQVITTPNFAVLTPDEMIKYAQVNAKNNQAAQILIATVPILVIYPFLQRFFMSGLTLGGVKG